MRPRLGTLPAIPVECIDVDDEDSDGYLMPIHDTTLDMKDNINDEPRYEPMDRQPIP